MTNHDSKHLALASKPTMFALAKKIKSKLWANFFGEKNQHFLSLPISDRFKKKELGPLPPLLKQQPNFFGFDFRFDPKKNLSNNFRRIAFFHSSKWDCFISETFFKFKMGVIQTKDRPNVCFFFIWLKIKGPSPIQNFQLPFSRGCCCETETKDLNSADFDANPIQWK